MWEASVSARPVRAVGVSLRLRLRRDASANARGSPRRGRGWGRRARGGTRTFAADGELLFREGLRARGGGSERARGEEERELDARGAAARRRARRSRHARRFFSLPKGGCGFAEEPDGGRGSAEARARGARNAVGREGGSRVGARKTGAGARRAWASERTGFALAAVLIARGGKGGGVGARLASPRILTDRAPERAGVII